MKNNLIAFFPLCCIFLWSACTPGVPPAWCAWDYYLVWGDEFDGETLDTSRWNTHTNNPAPYDRVPPRSSCDYAGAEVFLDKNVAVENGRLLLKTDKGPYRYCGIVGGKCGERDACGFVACDSFCLDLDYTSGSVTSRKNFNFGYFEARVKTAPGKGMYPVFWLWHHDELVVFEFFGDPTTQHVSMHRGEVYISEPFNRVADYSDDFHVYALEWTPLWVRWFFDGKMIKEEHGAFFPGTRKPVRCRNFEENTTYENNPAFPEGKDRWMGLNLSVNVYEWIEPDSNTVFPAIMEVDYVRVYQRKPEGPERQKFHIPGT